MTETDIYGKTVPILIRNVTINNKPAEIYLDGCGLIGEVAEKITDHDAEFIIDGSGAAALPGMINMHTHSPMGLLRGYSDDMPLFEWLSTKIWPTEATSPKPTSTGAQTSPASK